MKPLTITDLVPSALVLLAAGLLLSTSGCLVTLNMPELRYLSPLPTGAPTSGHVVVSAGQATKVVLVPSTLVSPPDTDHPAFADPTSSVGAGGELQIADRWELYARGSTKAPFMIGAKFALAGRAPQAGTRHEFGSALIAGAGGSRESGTDRNESSGLVTDRELRSYAVEAGLIAGEHFHALEAYGALYYSHDWANGTLRQDSARYRFRGDGDQVSVNAGLAGSIGRVDLRAEIARARSTWESGSWYDTAAGLGIGLDW